MPSLHDLVDLPDFQLAMSGPALVLDVQPSKQTRMVHQFISLSQFQIMNKWIVKQSYPEKTPSRYTISSNEDHIPHEIFQVLK